MGDPTEALVPYAKWILTGITLLYLAYVYANKNKFKQANTVAISGIMAALVTVATNLIKINVAQTGGYLNFGDTMVMFAAVLFGPAVGAFAGGVGSALGDIVGGYAGWAPITLVVKGLEGLLVGYIASKGRNDFSMTMLATIIGGTVMILGYFVAEIYLVGLANAKVEVPVNITQAVTGVIVGGGLAYMIKRIYPEVEDLV